MEIKVFSVGPFQENTLLLLKEGKALLIDPGFYSEGEYQAFKKAMGNAELLAVYLTHAHVDHILGLSRVLRDFEVQVYLSQEDDYLWENASSQGKMFGFHIPSFDVEPVKLEEGKHHCGPFSFEILYTPGHSPDHISFYFRDQKSLIAGDVLFRESIGRTDLYKGNFEVLARSIREKLYTLPDDTIVYPGHGPETSIAHEKNNNPFVKAASA
jgi:glyoxylase-like metal-dependent hydrolase (beta-lactamase superfamily II)